jgi:SAM-dependent methyltransferase
MTLPETPFNKTYFEDGVKAHVSGYENYRWKPEYVLPFANWLKQRFGHATILDYGCAKGFLVKALRMFNMNAFGYDVSDYAVEHCEPEVKACVFNDWEDAMSFRPYDVVVAKDVLEHIPEKEMLYELSQISFVLRGGGILVVVVPLGDDDSFRIREFELDVTHVTKKDEVWWTKKFSGCGFNLEEFYYHVPGIKDNWSQFPTGNGVFILSKARWDGIQ